jgi:hypothetical protein
MKYLSVSPSVIATRAHQSEQSHWERVLENSEILVLIVQSQHLKHSGEIRISMHGISLQSRCMNNQSVQYNIGV